MCGRFGLWVDQQEIQDHFELHDRMPVIVPVSGYDLWLDRTIEQPDDLKDLLIPCPSDDLEIYAASMSEDSAQDIGFAKYLKKPLDLETLAASVREVLDGEWWTSRPT